MTTETTATIFYAELPDGYEPKLRRKIAASTRKRAWTRDWYRALREIYEAGGYGWTRMGWNHMQSGMFHALHDRKAIEMAEHKRLPYLYRITPDGFLELAQWLEDNDYPDPTPPEGAPTEWVRTPKKLTEDEAFMLELHRDEFRAVVEALERFKEMDAPDHPNHDFIDTDMRKRMVARNNYLAREIRKLVL